MWLLSLRDLQWRRRRFLIGVFATSLIFALTLLMTGASAGLEREVTRIVDSFDADRWVVAEGATGPFTTTRPLPGGAVDEVAAEPGVRAAAPLILFRGSIGGEVPKDINLIGYDGESFAAPALAEGRQATGPDEVVADTALGLQPGDTVELVGRDRTVVGTADGVTFYFGLPTLFAPIGDVQDLAFGGQPIITTVITQGTPTTLPAGLIERRGSQVASDLQRITKNGKATIDFVRILLWLVAAGIIASIVYLTALERTGDFAVLKATGAPTRLLVATLGVQAVILAVASGLLAIPIALLLAPGFGFEVVLGASAYVRLIVVALAVGVLASLAGLRKVLTIDPALAFG